MKTACALNVDKHFSTITSKLVWFNSCFLCPGTKPVDTFTSAMVGAVERTNGGTLHPVGGDKGGASCRGSVITLIVPYLGVSTFLVFVVPRLYDVVRH